MFAVQRGESDCPEVHVDLQLGASAQLEQTHGSAIQVCGTEGPTNERNRSLVRLTLHWRRYLDQVASYPFIATCNCLPEKLAEEHQSGAVFLALGRMLQLVTHRSREFEFVVVTGSEESDAVLVIRLGQLRGLLTAHTTLREAGQWNSWRAVPSPSPSLTLKPTQFDRSLRQASVADCELPQLAHTNE